ncbi:hypothetical protein [Bradyrhizobium sp. cf659]|uniref:hypothetical protein n=1 Tax=Bradyrhizobium sp. cf659 TaxID=1761771 RepID=UPI0015A68788|nr:hypothetical protein [Bradyrhizobium sp. cf659]
MVPHLDFYTLGYPASLFAQWAKKEMDLYQRAKNVLETLAQLNDAMGQTQTYDGPISCGRARFIAIAHRSGSTFAVMSGARVTR